MSFKRKLVLLACLFFIIFSGILSCGVEEYYFLPQVPSGTSGGGYATILLQSMASIYYATNYTIFYRIYLSGENTLTVNTDQTSLRSINTALANDFSSFEALTNPANTTSLPALNTFSGRSYYELEYQTGSTSQRNIGSFLLKTGGTLRISFPSQVGDSPFITYNGVSANIRRNSTFTPKPDNLTLLNSTYIVTTNADVASGNGQFAYVSMYIVPVGQNPETIQRIYGKPTFLGIFLLSNATS